jgi:DNA-binding FadR family transcriptional regulator
VPLHAIRPRSLSEQVFEQLAAEIITGVYTPGAQLPAERALTDVFDVNRHVVREALKRLEQIGLVKISQGGGTRVLDFKRHAGLDLLAIMSEHARGGDDVAAIWLAVLEMRAAIAADLVRLCAERASTEAKAEMVAMARKMKAMAEQGATAEEIFRQDVLFWELLADGAANIAYRLSLNTMVRSAQVRGALAAQWSLAQLQMNDFHIPVAVAMAAGDGKKAEEMMRDILRGQVARFAAATGKVQEAEPASAPPARPRRAKPAK